MVQLFCSDFDGTIGKHGKISPGNVRAVHRLQEAGIRFVLVTGRPAANAQKILHDHGIDAHLIATNGAVVLKEAITPVADWTIPTEVVKEMLSEANRRRWFFIAYERDRCLVPQWLPFHSEGRAAQFVYRKTGVLPFRYGTEALSEWKIYKVNLFPRGMSQAEALAHWKADGRLYVTVSSKSKIECSAHGVSKWNGIRVLASSLGIPQDKIATIGDYDNDVPMLENAGLSFAMKNGTEAVKAVATQVVGDVAKDGFAEAVEILLSMQNAKKRK